MNLPLVTYHFGNTGLKITTRGGIDIAKELAKALIETMPITLENIIEKPIHYQRE